MSIRLKLTIMFLTIALIPTLFVGVLTFKNYRDSIESSQIHHLQDVLVFKADKIETYFSGLKADMELAQATYAVKQSLPIMSRYVKEPNNPKYPAALKMIDEPAKAMQKVFGLSDIMQVSSAGRVVYAIEPKHFGKDMAGGPYEIERTTFSEGKDKIYLSDPYFDKDEDNRYEILVSGPVYDFNGLFAGVVVFEVDMTSVYSLIEDKTGLGKTGESVVGKKAGNEVMYLSPLKYEPNAALTKKIAIGSRVAVPIQNAAQGKTGAGIAIDYRGKEVIGAWKYMPSLGWGIATKVDTSEAFADVANLQKLVMIIIVIIFVLVGVMAVSIARSIYEPINNLAKGAAMIGSGNLDYRVAMDSKDEIGELSRTFDRMTHDLKQTTASRDELNREIAERRQAEEELRKSRDELENRVKERTKELSGEIAERKKAEETLRSASLYARGLIESSLDPLVTISPKGKITDVNEAAVKVTGVERDRLIGTDFSNYFTEPQKAREGCQQVFAKGFVTDYPLTIRHKDGRLTDVLYNAAVYKNEAGQVQGVFAAARDVTIQKQAFQYARSLIESSLDPLVTISADGKITDVNEATVKVTGVGRQQLIGTDFSNYFTEPQKAREGYKEVFAKGFVTDYPLTIRHKDGRFTDVLYNATVYKDTHGSVLGVFAAARDVTEKKAAETELEKHRLHLEELVKQRTEELAESNVQLKRSNENLEQFAYVASHDLQEPLRIMASYSELLNKRYKNKLDKDADEFIKYIVESSRHMQKLITDILAYSRIGRADAAVSEVDFNSIVDRIVTRMSSEIETSKAAITHDELPTLAGNESSFIQLFQNLIGNAMKFRSKRSPKIHINAEKQGAEWLFSVRDNGIGIEEKFREKIFQIFQRLHGREQYPGTGIGLSICKKIVETHGGRIWVESQPSKGSTFYFTVPARGRKA